MPITKREVLDQIIVDPDLGNVSWRVTTVIEEDGVELTRSYNRRSAVVDENVPDAPPLVQEFRARVDTPEVRKRVRDVRAKTPANTPKA